MALTAPKPEQVKFARQIAWERGQRLATVPESSSALSGVIETLLQDYPPLPIHDRQVADINDLQGQCVANLEGFTVRDVPDNRADANKMIFNLRRRLSAAQYHGAKARASEFLVSADTPVERDVAAEIASTTVDAELNELGF